MLRRSPLPSHAFHNPLHATSIDSLGLKFWKCFGAVHPPGLSGVTQRATVRLIPLRSGPAGGGGAGPTRKAQGLCVEEAHRGAGGPSESWFNSLMKQEDEGSILGISCVRRRKTPYNLNPRNRKRTRGFISAPNSAVLSEGVRNAHQTANLRQSKSPLEKAY